MLRVFKCRNKIFVFAGPSQNKNEFSLLDFYLSSSLPLPEGIKNAEYQQHEGLLTEQNTCNRNVIESSLKSNKTKLNHIATVES